MVKIILSLLPLLGGCALLKAGGVTGVGSGIGAGIGAAAGGPFGAIVGGSLGGGITGAAVAATTAIATPHSIWDSIETLGWWGLVLVVGVPFLWGVMTPGPTKIKGNST